MSWQHKKFIRFGHTKYDQETALAKDDIQKNSPSLDMVKAQLKLALTILDQLYSDELFYMDIKDDAILVGSGSTAKLCDFF